MFVQARILGFSGMLVVAATPLGAAAQRADYVTPEELERTHGEGVPHAVSVSMLGRYAHIADEAKARGLRDAGDFALRTRAFVGRGLVYAAGLDGEVGGSNAGFTFGATAYLGGLGFRFGGGNVIALTGGVGL